MDIKPPKKPTNEPSSADLRKMMGKEPGNVYNGMQNSTEPKPDKTEPKPYDPLKNFEPDKENNSAKPLIVKKKKKLTKKKKIILAAVLLVIIAGIIGFFILRGGDEPQEVAVNNEVVEEEVKPEEPPKYYSPLTGKEFETEAPTKRPVTAVMVENSSAARPQSGLENADMVVEAIAESGVTRFMAVFQESSSDNIGPVRSARPYYLDYVLWLDASYGHVGGSPKALSDIKALGVKDIDEFANASTYWRATNRYAPHNAYTSSSRLDKANSNKGYTTSNFVPLERKVDVPQTPTASTININLSGPNYNSKYTYKKDTNSYLRNMAGQPHKDAQSGKQINPKVLVALVTSKGVDSNGYHTTYQTVGEGKAFVFQDGIVSEGTWAKNDRKSPLLLKDKHGLPMALNAGKTWITLVGSANEVRYSAQ